MGWVNCHNIGVEKMNSKEISKILIDVAMPKDITFLQEYEILNATFARSDISEQEDQVD